MHFRLLAALALSCLLLTACAQAPTGFLAMDAMVAEQFERGQILDNHDYYTMGSEVIPEAVIAIRRPYHLDSAIWSPIKADQALLNNWLFWFRTRESLLCTYEGGRLMATATQPVGIWYSRRHRATLWLSDEHTVQVSRFTSPVGSPCHQLERIEDQ